MIPAQATYDGQCVGCEGGLDDWTPGCKSCRERMRNRARRSGSPILMALYHMRAAQIEAETNQETARRRRDGEAVWVGGGVGRGGRFVS